MSEPNPWELPGEELDEAVAKAKGWVEDPSWYWELGRPWLLWREIRVHMLILYAQGAHRIAPYRHPTLDFGPLSPEAVTRAWLWWWYHQEDKEK